MPEVPNKITIDRRRHKVFIDGVEFPWSIVGGGPEVEDIANPDSLPIVTIPIIAADVEVIPSDGQKSVAYGDRADKTSADVMKALDD